MKKQTVTNLRSDVWPKVNPGKRDPLEVPDRQSDIAHGFRLQVSEQKCSPRVRIVGLSNTLRSIGTRLGLLST